MGDLATDPRWQRFNDAGRECPCCGQRFNGVFDIAMDHPDPWPHASRGFGSESDVVVGGDRLGSDLCHLGDHNFIRGVIVLPIHGTDQTFGFGCWGSASAETLEAYAREMRGGPSFAGGFSWLCNSLPGYGTDRPLEAEFIAGRLGQRPFIWVNEGPLAHAQRDGISFDELLDIYDAAGFDVRNHLLED